MLVKRPATRQSDNRSADLDRLLRAGRDAAFRRRREVGHERLVGRLAEVRDDLQEGVGDEGEPEVEGQPEKDDADAVEGRRAEDEGPPPPEARAIAVAERPGERLRHHRNAQAEEEEQPEVSVLLARRHQPLDGVGRDYRIQAGP